MELPTIDQRMPAVQPREIIEVNGVTMEVKNVASQSVVLHPVSRMIFVVKGKPMVLHKMQDDNLVLRPLKGAE